MSTGKWGSTTGEQVRLLRLRRGHKSFTFQYAKLPTLVNQLKSFRFHQSWQWEFTSLILEDTDTAIKMKK